MMQHANISFPPELPVSAYRAPILEALAASQVVIVCGDTGSGKTTQIPKMCLQRDPRRRIAVTQPRRLAAVTMAERVASELGGSVGGIVGYRHRYGRELSADTRILFQTDGVLLAETRSDPLLSGYGTVIVDEAHERSLNIDFLLGILKRILERRRDLRVVVSSATLDAQKFSAFFGGAPVVTVPGKLHPVEIRYRPPAEDEERDLARDVADAVAELPRDQDILVFLPGERDIREAAEALEGRGADEVIPLLASLPAAEQRRAFRLSARRRIVLATNVAETSVTIPGIRCVIDSGLARLSRYVHRTQVQRLQIEPVSQASARQRAGRCGRLGPGICIRLYAEEDFAARDAYTPPEVLRSSLAGVILTMLDLRLGDIERFPFIDPPKGAMIREGLRELVELGAVTHDRNGDVVLTRTGRKLARVPVEPRLARMLIAASEYACLPSVLPVVASMSCDNPKRRPLDEKEKADQAHAAFRVAGSDFLGTLALWTHWRDATRDLSQSKARALAKRLYLSYPKMREWRELTRQLAELCKRLGLSFAEAGDAAAAMRREPEPRAARAAADFSTRFHKALLSGLLARIGVYDPEERNYRGAGGLRFALHPSSVLMKRARRPERPAPGGDRARGARPPAFPAWIVAGELVDTERLYARDAAAIDPDWIEPVAGEACRYTCHSPEWDPQTGFVRGTERVTLHGLVIVPARRCDYARYDAAFARDVFLRRGLVDGAFPRPPPAVRRNTAFLDTLRKIAETRRRPELFPEDALAKFFDSVLPPDICHADALRRWLKAPRPEFLLDPKRWTPSAAGPSDDFPPALRVGGVALRLSYRHLPDEPERDGITCTVRACDAAALRLWRSDWLVPGALPEKLMWMLSVLPSAQRRVLSPLNDTVAGLMLHLKPGSAPLEEAVRATVCEQWGVRIAPDAWRGARLPPHLRVRFRIVGEDGKTLADTRDVDAALAAAGVAGAAGGVASFMPKSAERKHVAWDFGTLAEKPRDAREGLALESWQALHDEGDGVTIRLYGNRADAEAAHAAGVTRLMLLALGPSARMPFRRNRLTFDAARYLEGLDYDDAAVASDVLYGAVRAAFVNGQPPVRDAETFRRRLDTCNAERIRLQAENTAKLTEHLAEASRLSDRIETERIDPVTAGALETQLAWLFFPGFPRTVPPERFARYGAYLKGMAIRLERARNAPSSDLAKEARFAPYWEAYRAHLAKRDGGAAYVAARARFRWALEEYRLSVFAPEVRTAETVSPKRLDAMLAELED